MCGRATKTVKRNFVYRGLPKAYEGPDGYSGGVSTQETAMLAAPEATSE